MDKPKNGALSPYFETQLDAIAVRLQDAVTEAAKQIEYLCRMEVDETGQMLKHGYIEHERQ